MKRACIIGISGRLGQYMAGHALARGCEVVAVYRPQSGSRLGHSDNRIRVLPGRPKHRAVVERTLAGCDGVLCVAVPRGVGGCATGTAQAVRDCAEPGARLVFSRGWHISRGGCDVYPKRQHIVVSLFGHFARLFRFADLRGQEQVCRRILASFVGLQFRSDMRATRAAVAGHEMAEVATSIGPVETVDAGSGRPVLSIHGTGGGVDRGLALATGLRDAGHRVIATSRFGNSGAPIPDRTDARAQADAFAEQPDGRGVGRAIVMGASAGAIAGLAFAAQYPERTAALLLMVPAHYPASQAAPEPWSAVPTWAVARALRSDLLFWSAMAPFPTGMATTALATGRALIEAAVAGFLERALAED